MRTLVAALAALAFVGLPLAARADPAAPPVPRAAAWPADLPTDGDAAAPVTIVVASEFQCPFCARIAPTLRDVQARFPGKVRIAFAQFPLPFHREAEPAAKAALAAHRQGAFWPFHDALFAAQHRLGTDRYHEIAGELGLDQARFDADRAGAAVQASVARQQAALAAAGVTGTPTCFVNGARISGAQPVDPFVQAVEAAIADHAALPAAQQVNLRQVWEKHAPGGGQLYDWLIAGVAPPAPPAPEEEPLPKDDPTVWKVEVDPSRDAILGDGPQVALTVVVFTDLQCPFCARLHATLGQVHARLGARMRLVVKHNPLPFHNQAMPLHKALIAAGRQGRFYPFLDALFAAGPVPRGDQAELDAFVDGLAAKVGLDLARHRRDRADPGQDALIAADLRHGEQVGVDGTPTFYLNGRRVSGAVPVAWIDDVAAQEIAKADAANGRGHAYYLRATAGGKRIAPAGRPAAP